MWQCVTVSNRLTMCVSVSQCDNVCPVCLTVWQCVSSVSHRVTKCVSAPLYSGLRSLWRLAGDCWGRQWQHTDWRPSRDSQATPPPLPSSRGYNGQLFGNISNFHAILIKAILSHNWKYNMLYCYMLYWLESIFLLQFLLPRQKQTYDLSYLKSPFYII